MSGYRFIVCQSLLWADLGLPGVRVCLCVCVSMCSTDAVDRLLSINPLCLLGSGRPGDCKSVHNGDHASNLAYMYRWLLVQMSGRLQRLFLKHGFTSSSPVSGNAYKTLQSLISKYKHNLWLTYTLKTQYLFCKYFLPTSVFKLETPCKGLLIFLWLGGGQVKFLFPSYRAHLFTDSCLLTVTVTARMEIIDCPPVRDKYQRFR